MDKTQIRHAATIILIRKDGESASVLMGQRGSKAVFMPDKYVFPGGAVDADDASFVAGACLPHTQSLLELETRGCAPHALANAAIRELWEETGLVLGQEGQAPANVSADWQGFFDQGLVPHCAALEYVFRAITPPGRPRRFDARFFIADACHVRGDLDDFSHASDELSHLHWISLKEARNLALPFITEIVLSEVEALLAKGAPATCVPYFCHDEHGPSFRTLSVDSA